jgi:hypothetical protein
LELVLNSERRESEEGGGRLMGVPALDLALMPSLGRRRRGPRLSVYLSVDMMLNYCRDKKVLQQKRAEELSNNDGISISSIQSSIKQCSR